MRNKTLSFSNFSQAIHTRSSCFRPDNEWQLLMLEQLAPKVLARGQGLSYSDCCLSDGGYIVDCSRLNHLLSFNESTGLLYCQGGVTFNDLFSVHSDFIPPVMPGTRHATLAGALANDVHGKNNHHAGSIGHHIQWIELQIGGRVYRCSRERYAELFFASIGGVGLTGIIRRLGITLKKASRFVNVQTEKLTSLESLLSKMQNEGLAYDYQVAWLDLLSTRPKALLSLANHCELIKNPTVKNLFTVPRLPFRLINEWGMRQFNRFYFNLASTSPKIQPLSQFNNPLDAIGHWNRLYGKQGLLQFQAVFNNKEALRTIEILVKTIKDNKATPTLSVLKYFTQAGSGWLSFVKPGFTLAIDFIHNEQSKSAIRQMNQSVTDLGGRVYLAKDLFLTKELFFTQYPEHDKFRQLLKEYECPVQSDLGKRLGLI